MSEPIRILIADDHLIVREGLRMILETQEDLAVVGEASDGDMAIRMAEELQPNVVLMDLRMPNLNGLDAIEHIRAHWPDIQIVILTTYNEDDLMMRGLRAGACSYLLKDTDREALFTAIRAAARGETLLAPDILMRLLNRIETPAQPAEPSAGILTEREREV